MSVPKCYGGNIRTDLIAQVDEKITSVRELVSKLNEYEKEYMQNNSAPYRQLVDTIQSWPATCPGK